MTESPTASTGLPETGRTMRLPRSRGAVCGVLLVLLGAWAALAPFVAPYFHFGYTPHPRQSWHWTAARGWYEVLPGGLAVFAGLLLLVSTHRVVSVLAAWLGALGGGWLVVGPTASIVLRLGSIGRPSATTDRRYVAETLAFFLGIGALIILVAAIAIGRLSARTVRDVRAAAAAAREQAAAEEQGSFDQGSFDREPADREPADREPADREPADREPVDGEGAPVGGGYAVNREPYRPQPDREGRSGVATVAGAGAGGGLAAAALHHRDEHEHDGNEYEPVRDETEREPVRDETEREPVRDETEREPVRDETERDDLEQDGPGHDATVRDDLQPDAAEHDEGPAEAVGAPVAVPAPPTSQAAATAELPIAAMPGPTATEAPEPDESGAGAESGTAVEPVADDSSAVDGEPAVSTEPVHEPIVLEPPPGFGPTTSSVWGTSTGQGAPAQVWNPEDQHPTTTGELPRLDEQRSPDQPRRYYRPAARPESNAGETAELPIQPAPAYPAPAQDEAPVPPQDEASGNATASTPAPEAIRQDEEIGHDLDLDEAPSQGR